MQGLKKFLLIFIRYVQLLYIYFYMSKKNFNEISQIKNNEI